MHALKLFTCQRTLNLWNTKGLVQISRFLASKSVDSWHQCFMHFSNAERRKLHIKKADFPTWKSAFRSLHCILRSQIVFLTKEWLPNRLPTFLEIQIASYVGTEPCIGRIFLHNPQMWSLPFPKVISVIIMTRHPELNDCFKLVQT